MNLLILLFLALAIGGGYMFMKRRQPSSEPVNIPPVAPAQWQSSWQPPNISNTLPTNYSSIGGYREQATANPGITRSFVGKTGGCGCNKGM